MNNIIYKLYIHALQKETITINSTEKFMLKYIKSKNFSKATLFIHFMRIQKLQLKVNAIDPYRLLPIEILKIICLDY